MTGVSCNGQPADAALLAPALVNYGHFTSLQVRAGAVQGLDLHLQRLAHATGVLFGSALDTAQVRQWMGAALQQAGMADASLRVTVFSRAFDFRDPLAPVAVDTLVAVSPPMQLTAARSVRTATYQRDQPALKHVGTFGLFDQRRQAMAAGFDDALFLGAGGMVSEGSTWNLAMHDGERLLWPQAPALRGIADGDVVRVFNDRGAWEGPQAVRPVAAAELADVKAAFACNASGIWPLAAIDGHVLQGSADLAAQGRAVMARVPWQPLR